MNVSATINYHSETRYPTRLAPGEDYTHVDVMLITLHDLPSPHKFPIRILQTKVVNQNGIAEQSIKPLTHGMRYDMHETLAIETFLIQRYIESKMEDEHLPLDVLSDEFDVLSDEEDEFPW